MRICKTLSMQNHISFTILRYLPSSFVRHWRFEHFVQVLVNQTSREKGKQKRPEVIYLSDMLHQPIQPDSYKSQAPHKLHYSDNLEDKLLEEKNG